MTAPIVEDRTSESGSRCDFVDRLLRQSYTLARTKTRKGNLMTLLRPEVKVEFEGVVRW